MLSVIVFDLDETIYPRSSGLMHAVSERISRYMIERMGMDPQLVPRLRREYWQAYGTTSRGLQLLHDLDVDDYMLFVHDLPVSEYVTPDPVLDTALASLAQRKVIFTNATAAHARAVLQAMGIAHHFDAVYDVFFVRHQGKPSIGAYHRLLAELGVEGVHCLMVEDMVRNLRPAKELGMVTALVDPAPGADLEGADYVIDRVADIVQVVAQVERGSA